MSIVQAELNESRRKVDELERRLRTLEGDISGFTREQHVKYVLDFWKKEKEQKDSFEMLAIEHIRVQGVFWAIGSLQILGAENLIQDKMNEVVDWVMKCYSTERGGFGGNIGHDTNLINTQFAIYVLAQCNALDKINPDKVAEYIKQRQQDDGSFADEWSGEHDSRYTCCALFALKMINRLDVIDLDKAVGHILNCRNASDGAFGQVPNAESHAAFTYTALASLQVAGYKMDQEEIDELAWWLCERQCDSGGLNGRPEKQADVCYSFWALTCLKMLDRIDWLDTSKLTEFILSCQDTTGGIADRPNNIADLFHTFFGLCGLELLHQIDSQADISPIYALPIKCLPFSA